MKVLEAIKKILIGTIGVVYFSFALVMTILLLNYNDYGVTQFGNKSLVIINDEVSTDTYKNGDLVITERKRIDRYVVGEDIFTYRVDSKGLPHIQIGKVGTIYEDENAISFENGENYSMDFIAGTPVKIHPNAGKFLSIVESQWGFLFIVLVPCFLIFIYEVYSLIIEIKYGADEK